MYLVTAWRPGAAGGGSHELFVEGDYFEVCNCDVSCNCVWLGTATHDNCDVLLAWHVASGSTDGVELSGLNAVMALHSPKRMTVLRRSSPKPSVRSFPGVLVATWPGWPR